MGVEIHLNTLAVDMDHHSITVKGPDGVQTIPCRSRIWAAGVQAFPLAKLLAEKIGAEVERAGRVPVNPDCSLPGHPEVFAIGDMVSLNKLPGVAQPALQEGRYVGKVIRKRLAGETKIRPFKYFNKGSMATIGYRAAVADAFGLKVTGLLAYVMWGFIHVLYLIGWGNRIGTIYTWFRALVFSKNRGHRVITFETATDEIAEGRTASGRPAPILPPLNRQDDAPITPTTPPPTTSPPGTNRLG
jgi:NADH:quinone reductase (non-electrogenic)